MKITPKQIVLDRFETRGNLVDAILNLMSAGEKDDRTAARLKAAKNAQLLRIHDVLGEVQERFGSRDALIQDIAQRKFAGKNEDQAYVQKLQDLTSKRLLDLHRQVS